MPQAWRRHIHLTQNLTLNPMVPSAWSGGQSLGVHFYGKVKKMLQALKMDAPHLNDNQDRFSIFFRNDHDYNGVDL